MKKKKRGKNERVASSASSYHLCDSDGGDWRGRLRRAQVPSRKKTKKLGGRTMARTKTISAAKQAKAPRAKRTKKLKESDPSVSSSVNATTENEEDTTLEGAARKAYRVLNHYALDEQNIEGLLDARRALKQALRE
jgi:hypothetical protein